MLSRKQSSLLAGLLIALVILVACVPPPPASPAAPTSAAPTEAPADAFIPAPVPPPTDELRMLRANSWQWTAFEDSKGRIEVGNPASYRVTFNSDASLAIGAGCNNATGSYQGEGGKLTIGIGPVTMATCPQGTESLSNKFIDLLASAVNYSFEGDTLRINLLANSGVMTLAPAGEAAGAEAPATVGSVTAMPSQHRASR